MLYVFSVAFWKSSFLHGGDWFLTAMGGPAEKGSCDSGNAVAVRDSISLKASNSKKYMDVAGFCADRLKLIAAVFDLKTHST